MREERLGHVQPAVGRVARTDGGLETDGLAAAARGDVAHCFVLY